MLELDLVVATYKTKMQSSNESKQKPNKKKTNHRFKTFQLL
jgi:hypothetical protein